MPRLDTHGDLVEPTDRNYGSRNDGLVPARLSLPIVQSASQPSTITPSQIDISHSRVASEKQDILRNHVSNNPYVPTDAMNKRLEKRN